MVISFYLGKHYYLIFIKIPLPHSLNTTITVSYSTNGVKGKVNDYIMSKGQHPLIQKE